MPKEFLTYLNFYYKHFSIRKAWYHFSHSFTTTKSKNNKTVLTDVTTPDLKALYNTLKEKNEEGRDIYMGAGLYNQEFNSEKKSVSHLRALCLDIDDGDYKDKKILPASIVLKRYVGDAARYQVFWLFDYIEASDKAIARYTHALNVLIGYYKGDSGAKGYARFIRMPFFPVKKGNKQSESAYKIETLNNKIHYTFDNLYDKIEVIRITTDCYKLFRNKYLHNYTENKNSTLYAFAAKLFSKYYNEDAPETGLLTKDNIISIVLYCAKHICKPAYENQQKLLETCENALKYKIEKAEKNSEKLEIYRELCKDWCAIQKRTTFMRLDTMEELEEKSFNRVFRTGFGVKNPADYAYQHSLITQYYDTEFKPGVKKDFVRNKDQLILNTWIEPAFPVTGDTPQEFLNHVDYISNGNSQDADTILNFLAFSVQKPEIKIAWVLHLFGQTKGTGKTYFERLFVSIFGETQVSIISNKMLNSPYDLPVINKKILCLSELKFLTRPDNSSYDDFKRYITDSYLSIRLAYGKNTDVRNVWNIISTSNKNNSYPDWDRRVYPIETPVAIKDKDHYYALYNELNSDTATIYHYLKDLEINNEDFDPNFVGEGGATKAFLQSTSESDTDIFLKNAFEEKEPPFSTDVVDIEAILQDMAHGKNIKLSRRKIIYFLRDATDRKLEDYRVSIKSGYRKTLHVIRNFDKYRPLEKGKTNIALLEAYSKGIADIKKHGEDVYSSVYDYSAKDGKVNTSTEVF